MSFLSLLFLGGFIFYEVFTFLYIEEISMKTIFKKKKSWCFPLMK